MALVGERAFNALNESGWSDFPWTSNMSFVSDPAAPHSAAGILRATFPTGYSGGAAPGTSWLNFPNTPVRTVYAAFWTKFSANFYGHASNVNKQAYFRTPAFNGLFVFVANGAGTNALYPEIRIQGTVTYGTYNLAPNLVPGAIIPRGQWNLVEIVAVGNTAGNTDGSIDVYLNGIHVTSYAMQWESGGTTWGYFTGYPDWGGTGDTMPATCWMDWDHAYVSGK
jgi:hypothetical protein